RLSFTCLREIVGSRLSRYVGAAFLVYRYCVCSVILVTTKICGVDKRSAARIELRDECVAVSSVLSLKRTENREIDRLCATRDISITCLVYRYSIASVIEAAAQVCRIDKRVAARIELRYECVLLSASILLQRAYCREIARVCQTCDIGIACRI